MTCTEAARILQALANAKRLKIIELVSAGEICACELLAYFEITQPTLSYDMKLLQELDLVRGRPEGKWTYYSLNRPKLREFHDYLDDVFFHPDRRLDDLSDDLSDASASDTPA